MNKTDEIRYEWADFCRVIATLGVIIIHTTGPTIRDFSPPTMTDWISANFLNSITRASVPLFFMLSGTLLLNRNQGKISLYSLVKRVSRLAIPLAVWSTLYLANRSYNTGQPIDIISIFQKPAMYHLWFVYSLIGVYLLLPFLQAIFDTIKDRKDYQLFFLTIWFIIVCLPNYLKFDIIKQVYPTGFLGYSGYFIIGAVISHNISKYKNNVKTKIYLSITVLIISIISTFLITYFISMESNTAKQIAYKYFSPNVFLSSISSFYLFHFIVLNKKLAKFFTTLSGHTFVIYLVHIFILSKISWISKSLDVLPVILQITLTSCLTFAIGLLVSYLLRPLPKSKQIFG